MTFSKSALCGAIVAAACTGSALAGDSSAYVVTGGSDHFAPRDHRHADIAKSQLQKWVRVYPMASTPITSVPDSGQRILPYLAQVQYAQATTIYVNPYENLGAAGKPANAGIDEDHSLKRAQRIYLSLTTGGSATVIINPDAPRDHRVAIDDIQPRAIIHIPPGFRHEEPKPEKKTDDKPRRIAAAN